MHKFQYGVYAFSFYGGRHKRLYACKINSAKEVIRLRKAGIIMEFDLTLYGITDTKNSCELSLCEQVEQAILGGITILQYREKELTGEEKKKEAIAVRDVCRAYGVPFIINDDVALAVEIDADGVHLGQGDMEISMARRLLEGTEKSKEHQKIIGITAKTVEQAKMAELGGADYLGSGAVFSTATKLDAKPLPHEMLDRICESVSIPVVAIGGIERENILHLKGRKMSGFAVVGGIFRQKNIRTATEELKKLAMETLEK